MNHRPQIDLNYIRTTLQQHGYEYIQPLKDGGFATIHLVQSKKYNVTFVVKIALHEENSDKNSEINVLMHLSHPNIISIYDYFEVDDYSFFILEYCQGGSLDEYMSRGLIQHENIVEYWRQILLAIQYCHQEQVVHGDIKPANILISASQKIKVADFGLSHFSAPGYTSSFFAGSGQYIAPEIIQRRDHDPYKSDVWSLGIMFYEMYFGHRPWKVNNMKELEISILYGPIQFQPGSSSRATALLYSMLQRDPNQRPSVCELLQNPIFHTPQKKQIRPTKSKGLPTFSQAAVSKIKGSQIGPITRISSFKTSNQSLNFSFQSIQQNQEDNSD